MICVIIGQIMRYLGVIIATLNKKYNCKERMFMGVCYIVKSTAVASVAGTIFTEASALGDEYKDYQDWGLQM
jgi:NhaP-type Na+/H+ or K+/H+ antiporter